MYALQIENTSESGPCSYEATKAVAKKARKKFRGSIQLYVECFFFIILLLLCGWGYFKNLWYIELSDVSCFVVLFPCCLFVCLFCFVLFLVQESQQQTVQSESGSLQSWSLRSNQGKTFILRRISLLKPINTAMIAALTEVFKIILLEWRIYKHKIECILRMGWARRKKNMCGLVHLLIYPGHNARYTHT